MKDLMHLVLIGAPGAGKGTVAKELKDFVQLSTGDMLRIEAKKDTPFGTKVADLINNGKFVDNETMFSVIKENLPQGKQLIFDGYPRNVAQIEYFEKLVPNKNNIVVIYFNISPCLLKNRIVNRKTCSVCGEIHNNTTNLPNNGSCNKCGGELNQRKDDNETALLQRIETFEKETLPMLDTFKKYRNYFEVDASQSVDSVIKNVKDIIGKKVCRMS